MVCLPPKKEAFPLKGDAVAKTTIKVCIPPEEEVFASKACGINICKIVCLFVYKSKATENDSNRQVC